MVPSKMAASSIPQTEIIAPTRLADATCLIVFSYTATKSCMNDRSLIESNGGSLSKDAAPYRNAVSYSFGRSRLLQPFCLIWSSSIEYY